MTQITLEERVAALERQLAHLISSSDHIKLKDWKATFGMFANDPEFDEVLSLGREIRHRQTTEENGDASA